jgi:hypothetical protein
METGSGFLKERRQNGVLGGGKERKTKRKMNFRKNFPKSVDRNINML